ncbi:bromodomain and WD repeat-containing protein 3 [Anabrus simplex]|uniref:bromodomain and WD repeat-containing protein 3 n=1 Tax=Anabrus simplex TaxID=316456 RepID=UPI0035A28175
MESDTSSREWCVASELYFLIAKFLAAGPCQESAQVLRRELENSKVLPKRFDWLGNEYDQTFEELERKYPHIGPRHLLEICQRIGPILEKEIKPCIPGLSSLLGAGRQSLLRTHKDLLPRILNVVDYAVRRHGCSISEPIGISRQHNIVKVLQGREASGPLNRRHAVSSSLYSKQQLYCRSLGHLSAVYCLLFDRTGRYVITGADDLLVKIWSTIDGRLMATLRGATAEITDIAVNLENTLLAAGSLDKLLRVWSLQSTAPVAILSSHTGMITAVHFCPMTSGDVQYLISTSTDGSVAFWSYQYVIGGKYNFQPKPIQYNERMRPGHSQMICASFSPGGMFLAAGSADHHVRVYMMEGEEGPHRILETEAHSDRVDSIQWANSGLRFISGSKDGTAHVWHYECQQWKSLPLLMSTKLPNTVDTEEDPKAKLKVTMVCWDQSDSWVVTAVSDYTLKVWNSFTGQLVQILRGHKDEVFVLESHPYDPHVLLSAGHDGQIFIWDIITGKSVASFQNTIEGQGHGAVFDAKWSPDGTMLAATDSHGHILMFGFGSGFEYFGKLPNELFFHTDYRPLIRDANHFVLDEQTQVPPHLMPPPFLVDIDGNPYPPYLQRLVPGRENCQGEQLVPNIIVGAGGQQEVIEGLPSNEPRSNIDQMIAALAIRHRGGAASASDNATAGRQGGTSENTPTLRHVTSPRSSRVGMRRTGDVEGVRQSSGNWQRGSDIIWHRRSLARPLNPAEYCSLQAKMESLANSEMDIYKYESHRRPVEQPSVLPSSRNQGSGGRRYNRGVRQQHNYRTRAAREQPMDSEFENPENLDITASGTSGSDRNNDDSTAREEDLNSSSSTSDTESSEYSDWIADAGVNLEPPKRSKRRPVKKPTPSPPSDRPQRQQRKKVIPPPPTAGEVPELYRPPEWLSEVIPRKAPYYPQMGDEVMYFRQGHQLYLNAVRMKKVYDVGPRSEPWSRQRIRAYELVKVIGIKYEIRPPRLCCLKLAVMDADGRLTGDNFTIKYHDMADVLDFLVLRQIYLTGTARSWKVGDRFRCMIDDCWWMGRIESQAPFEPEFPHSPFMCYRVRWDNGEYELMSPWDLEPVNENRLPREVGGAVPVLPEEIQAILYQPRAEEWPQGDRDAACLRILAGLDEVMSLAIAESFIAPVDLNQYPSYAFVVEYPIDLSTIKRRFENRFYRRITSAQFDVRYIATNAEKFNEPRSQIVKKARLVTELCLRVIKDRNIIDVPAVYHQLLDAYQSSDSESEVDVEKPGPSNTVLRRSERSKKTSIQISRRSQVQPSDWRRDCRELLETLWMCEDSTPFREPVDALEFPDYFQVVDTPMDLRTIKEDLLGGNYENPLEFCKDMRLMFTNSKNYNTNKRSRIYSMTVRLSAMFEEHMKKIISNWNLARRREMMKKMSEKMRKSKKQRGSAGSGTRTRVMNGAGPSRRRRSESEDSYSCSDSDKPLRKPSAPRKPPTPKKSGASAVANGHIRTGPATRPPIRLRLANFRGGKAERKNISNSDSESGSSSSSSSNSNSSSASSNSSSSSFVNNTGTSNSRRVNPRANKHIYNSQANKPVVQPRGKKRRRHSDSEDSYRPGPSGSVRTRNRGKQKVRYREEYSDRPAEDSEASMGGQRRVRLCTRPVRYCDDSDSDTVGVKRSMRRYAKDSDSDNVKVKRSTRGQHLNDFDPVKVRRTTRGQHSKDSDSEPLGMKRPTRGLRSKDSDSDLVVMKRATRGLRPKDSDSDMGVAMRRTRGQRPNYAPESEGSAVQSEESDDGTAAVRPTRARKTQYREASDDSDKAVLRRTRGKRTHYAEDSDSSDLLPSISISSRGRVRKLTPRARALFTK